MVSSSTELRGCGISAAKSLFLLGRSTGIEPATSGTTNHSAPLNLLYLLLFSSGIGSIWPIRVILRTVRAVQRELRNTGISLRPFASHAINNGPVRRCKRRPALTATASVGLVMAEPILSVVIDSGQERPWRLLPDRRYNGPLAGKSETEARALLHEALAYFAVGYSAPPMPPGTHQNTESVLRNCLHYLRTLASEDCGSRQGAWRDIEAAMRVEEADGRDRLSRDYDAMMQRCVADARDMYEVQHSTTPKAVYFIGATDGPIKIGMAVDPLARMASLQTSHATRLCLYATTTGGRKQEAAYHRRFARHRLHGEWFDRHADIIAEIAELNRDAVLMAQARAAATDCEAGR
jgi:hypothetical protein